jgi:hypothetical protein
MIYREYEIEPSRWVAVSGTLGFDAQARGFGPAHAVGEGLKPAASNRRVFLLNWAGAATCRFSLTGRWFRGAAEGSGRENRAAHRRSHRL